ncbi:restriction endonuclease subunit S [Methanobrevibacter sp.]|uniref:restriction endonuclease subunit S n=1 Tax=Methanobrevibacter sp. TaxID=66852 RepID=UPI0025F38C24|nr:restriction endonuclease subunit S [Methanobrevibacter sp.]
MIFLTTHIIKLFYQLRFSGFKDNWENTKIGDCLDVKYGKDYKHLNKGKYPVLGTGGIMEYVDEFLYSGESILIGRKGTIDKPKYIDDSFWTVDTLFYTEIKKQFPKFLFYCISNINWLKYNEASGVPSLSANNIKNVKINIPELIEQKKIANFLTSIDYKIELLDAKHKYYVEFKRYLMQQIFTQKLRIMCT